MFRHAYYIARSNYTHWWYWVFSFGKCVGGWYQLTVFGYNFDIARKIEKVLTMSDYISKVKRFGFECSLGVIRNPRNIKWELDSDIGQAIGELVNEYDFIYEE